MTSSRPGFRSDIEGLRGVAILLVVAFHAGMPWLAGGYVGVDVFFVLSGFLITGLLAREVEATGDIDLSEFYARRARRLLPALLVVLLATIAARALALRADRSARRRVRRPRRRAALRQHSVRAERGQLPRRVRQSAAPHLVARRRGAVLLLWPLLFAARPLASRRGATSSRRLLTWRRRGGRALVRRSLWVTRVAQPWAFFGMPTRIWEFAAGGAVALWRSTQARLGQRAFPQRTRSPGRRTRRDRRGRPHRARCDALPRHGRAASRVGTVALLVGGRTTRLRTEYYIRQRLGTRLARARRGACSGSAGCRTPGTSGTGRSSARRA